MTNISKHPLLKQAYELCRAIEEFPASEQQTNTIVKASALSSGIEALVDEFDCYASRAIHELYLEFANWGEDTDAARALIAAQNRLRSLAWSSSPARAKGSQG